VTDYRPRGSSDPGAIGGFTLLEVMAAVAILAIWFVVIAGSAMHALRAEGISKRRLEAALIADREMALLEATTVDGAVPKPASDVREDGDYTITVDISPLSQQGAPGARPQAGAPSAADEEAPDLLAVLAADIPDRMADLRKFEVRVAWEEGGLERSVTRTSFAFDLANAIRAYDEAGIPGASGAPTTPPAETVGDEQPTAQEDEP